MLDDVNEEGERGGRGGEWYLLTNFLLKSV
jgi:hypothetical protein